MHERDDFTRLAGVTVPDTGASEGSYSINDLIRGLYRVVAAPVEGGFGRVFHVYHTGWDVELAMKQPKKNTFVDELHKKQFINECNVWIDLGRHPHIVSCYYVRDIDGIPSIFSEWMNGGSLKEWIYGKSEDDDDYRYFSRNSKPSGKLYDGGKKAALERILDIAVQFARGLRYAHKQNIIHQDVKPANLLMTDEGMAKVADFGIAGAIAKLERNAFYENEIAVSENIYTEDYCSPEQKDGCNLTLHTDIWSWAVSILEMFLGDRPWDSGVTAGMACNEYFNRAYIPVPDTMKQLLKRCFEVKTEKRPANFAEIEALLCEIYQTETGTFYARPNIGITADTADILNNKALSFLDIGMTDKAERCWNDALEKQPDHIDCIFNTTVYLWRNGYIDDMQAADTLKNMYENHPDNHNATWLYANLCVERHDYQTAISLMNDKKETFRDKKYSAFLNALKSPDRKQNLHILSNKIVHTGLLHIADEGSELFSASTDGIEKWKLVYTAEKQPCNLIPVNRHEWEWKQVKLFCFSDDGKYLLTLEGKEDENGCIINGKAICLWNTDGYRCLHRFASRMFMNSQPKEACFSRNGKQILTLAWGENEDCSGELKIWDIDSRKCIRTVAIDEKNVSAVSFSPDRLSVATGNRQGFIKLFDTATGNLLQTFRKADKKERTKQSFQEDILHVRDGEEQYRIQTLRFAPNGRLAASYSNGVLGLWNISDGSLIYMHRAGVGNELYFFPEGSHLFTVFSGCRLIDADSGRCINTSNDIIPNANILYLNRKYALTTAGTDRDNPQKGLFLLSLPDFGSSPEIKWALSRVINTHDLEAQQRRFRQIVAEAKTHIQKKDIKAALKSLEETFRIPFVHWHTRQKLNDDIGKYCRIKGVRSLVQERAIGKTNCKFAFSPEGYVISKGRLYDVVNGKYLHKFEDSPDLYLYAFSPDNKFVYGVVGNPKNVQHIKVFDPKTGKCLFSFNSAHNSAINDLRVSHDGKYLLSGSEDRTAKLWNTGKRCCINVFAHEREVKSVCFGPDMRSVITFSTAQNRRQGEILKWDARSGEDCLVRDNVCCICPDHSNSRLILGKTGGVEVIDLNTFETIAECRHKNDPNYCATDVKFLPDERYALSSGTPGAICYWNLDEQKHLLSLQNKSLAISIHPGGNYAIAYAANCYLIHIDHFYEFPGWTEWDEGARPFLEKFLTLYPDCTEEQVLQILIPELQNRGFGWIEPEGIQVQLKNNDLLNA
ncbi:MAG: protein kinase, partial [Tannerella sp.]|nr:protein kinase [Tannerella sp.]